MLEYALHLLNMIHSSNEVCVSIEHCGVFPLATVECALKQKITFILSPLYIDSYTLFCCALLYLYRG